MKRFLKQYWHWLLATLIFVLLLMVFSDMNVFEYVATRANVRRLRAETESFRERSAADSMFVEQMRSDEFVERYAREKFFMHSDDEEVFIVKER